MQCATRLTQKSEGKKYWNKLEQSKNAEQAKLYFVFLAPKEGRMQDFSEFETNPVTKQYTLKDFAKKTLVISGQRMSVQFMWGAWQELIQTG